MTETGILLLYGGSALLTLGILLVGFRTAPRNRQSSPDGAAGRAMSAFEAEGKPPLPPDAWGRVPLWLAYAILALGAASWLVAGLFQVWDSAPGP